MALDPTQIRSWGGDQGGVYVADVGATEPAADEALNGEWTHLGHVSDDSVKAILNRAREGLITWQSHPYTARNLRTAASSTVQFSLEQWNRDTIGLALGDGTWTEDATGFYTFEPPAETDTNEKAIAIEAYDGDDFARLIFRRTDNEAATEVTFSAAKSSPFAITMTILAPPEGVDRPYILQVGGDAYDTGS